MISSSPIHISFICTGNICRSPMAEAILRHVAQEQQRTNLRVTSAGTGHWHVGDPPDHRALAELSRHGYSGDDLRASQVSDVDYGADLLIALDNSHRSYLIASGADENKVELLRNFDPTSPADSDVADPYYGGPEGFSETRRQIEAAIPGILQWVDNQTVG